MRSRNFPGRKHARRVRARQRAEGRNHATEDVYPGKGARPNYAHPTVKDQRWRIGAAGRDAETGEARS